MASTLGRRGLISCIKLRHKWLYPVVSSIQPHKSFQHHSREPFHPISHKDPVWKSPDEAVQAITSGDRVYVHGMAATPTVLLEALCKYGKSAPLSNVELLLTFTAGQAEYAKPEFEGIFRTNSCFTGVNCRDAVAEGRGDFIPIFLSEIPLLFRRHILNLDVALIQVSPPDNHGFCTLGPSVECTRAAVQNAKHIIAQVNPHMPRTFGDGVIHMSHCDTLVHGNVPLPELHPKPATEVENKIGQLIADNLVRDGATLQMGIGSIPQSLLSKLFDHRDLGIHSEMISDGVIDLVDCGAITNAKKVIQTGKIVCGFCMGTKRLYDFLNNNPFVAMCDISFVNSTGVIAQNPRVTAINACIEVDLTGQVVSDSIGTKIYSGVGGQIDFIRGASLGLDEQGKPILAMASTTSTGESKIVPTLKAGGGVVTTRAHVHYIVTEYGIAYLFSRNLRQRAYELIRIAHPDHREALERASFERLKCMPSP